MRLLMMATAAMMMNAFAAACASHQYVPVRQTVKAPDKVKKEFVNVSPAALNQHRQAMALFNQGDYAGAARHWRDALQAGARDPDFQFEINYNLGVTFLRMGKFILAEQHFRKAVALNGAEARAFTGLGGALASQDRLAEALEEYRKALAVNPMMSEAYSGIAGISVQNGNYEQAIDCMRAAMQASPGDQAIRSTAVTVYIALADHELFRRNLDGAEELYAIAASLDPQNPRPLYGEGRALLRRGYPGRALPFYKKARDLAPNFRPQPEDILPVGGTHPDAAEAVRAESMAAFFLERGDYERAAEQYEIALTREPTKLETWLALGDLCLNRLNRPEKAADCIHALWMLGVADRRVDDLALRYGQDSPRLSDIVPAELLWAQAGRILAPGGLVQKETLKAFPAGSRIYRQAAVRVSPGLHHIRSRLIGPGGRVFREDACELDCVAPERKLTSFDSLLQPGSWRQEWWIDQKLVGALNFDLL